VDQIEIPWVLLAIISSLAALQTIRLRYERGRGVRRARARTRHAIAGEHSAEKLLKAAGFRIAQRQPGATVQIWVDGDPLVIAVRGDLLVRRRGRLYLAEVKTGDKAPRITHGPTRRQLLEYRYAFDVDGLLLVDADGGTIREIAFEKPRSQTIWQKLVGAA